MERSRCNGRRTLKIQHGWLSTNRIHNHEQSKWEKVIGDTDGRGTGKATFESGLISTFFPSPLVETIQFEEAKEITAEKGAPKVHHKRKGVTHVTP